MDQADADAIVTKAIENLPEEVQLAYISYDDQLYEDQLTKILDGGVDEFLEVENGVCDHFRGWDGEMVKSYATDVLAPLLRTWNEDHEGEPDLEDDWDCARFESQWDDEWAELEEAIRDRDQSDPFGDLLDNTHPQLVRFTLNDATFDDSATDTDLLMLCEQLHVDPAAYLPVLRGWAADSGGCTFQISILWYAEIADIVRLRMQKLFEDPERMTDPLLKWKHVNVLPDEYGPEDFNDVAVLLDDGSIRLEDNNDWSNTAFKSQHSIVSMFEDYRQRLVDFYKYRAKLLGAAT